MRQWIGSLRLIWIAVLLLIVGLVAAQEDLDWLLDLLPNADDINVNKLLSQTSEGQIFADESPLEQAFDAVNSWSADDSAAWFFRPEDGQFTMFSRERDFALVALDRSQTEYTDVIISVNIIQEANNTNHSYGLVCRAQEDNSGYHFYVRNDGNYAIQLREGEEINWLTQWTPTELIKQETEAVNRMMAVCIDDYFALYLNGILVSEVRDRTYQEGMVGMLVTLLDSASVTVNFDNLWIWEAAAEGLPVACPANGDVEFSQNFDPTEREAILLRCLEKSNQTIELQNLVFEDDFSNADDWDVVDEAGAFLGIEDNLMLGYADEMLATLNNEEWYDNVVIQIDTQFLDGSDNNAYGLMCRANQHEVSRGYYFNISADGFYSIWISDGDSFRFLSEWLRSEAINVQGNNRLTVICIDDYLAFYANNELLIETFDSIYSSGSVGITLTSFEQETEIGFDNLLIWDAALISD